MIKNVLVDTSPESEAQILVPSTNRNRRYNLYPQKQASIYKHKASKQEKYWHQWGPLSSTSNHDIAQFFCFNHNTQITKKIKQSRDFTKKVQIRHHGSKIFQITITLWPLIMQSWQKISKSRNHTRKNPNQNVRSPKTAEGPCK